MTKDSLEEEILKEFDDKFMESAFYDHDTAIWFRHEDKDATIDDIKSFIKYALASQRQEVIDGCIKALPKPIEDLGKTFDLDWNDCLQEIKSKLNNLKGER